MMGTTEQYKQKTIHRRARKHILDVKKRFMKSYQKQLAEAVKKVEDHEVTGN